MDPFWGGVVGSTGAPCVSVVMPVYNGSRYLAETIDSILAQTLRDWELVAVDDGSTDDSWALLQKYAAQDERIRIEQLPQNSGHRAASNRAFELARGEYVARTDQDDISLPRRLELEVHFLEDHPDVGLVGSGYYRWLPSGEMLARPKRSGHTLMRWGLLFDNVLCHSTLMFRREWVSGPNAYHYAPAAYDYEVCARLARHTRLGAVRDPLVLYRIHAGGLSATAESRMKTSALAISFRQMRRLLGPRHVSRNQLCALRRLASGRGIDPQDAIHVPLLFKLLDRFAVDANAKPEEIRHIRRQILRRLIKTLPLRSLGPVFRSNLLEASRAFVRWFYRRSVRQSAHAIAWIRRTPAGL